MVLQYTTYKEYLKSKNLHQIKCDTNLEKLSNIKNYPDSKQYQQFIICGKIELKQ